MTKEYMSDNYELECLLEKINSYVQNNFKQLDDEIIYGKKEHWSSIEEIIENKSGDCEDLSYMKRHLLIQEGINDKYLHLIIGLKHGHGHMILVYSDGERKYVLDNYEKYVTKDYIDFEPRYLINDYENKKGIALNSDS